MTIDGTTVDLTAGEQVRFPGEAVVAVVLSRPTRALNVMTRRGRCVAQVALRPADAPARGEGTVSVDLGERIAEVRVTIAPRL
ncbi:MAG TPA: HutD family protein [Dermatophilaceae bacterium]|nr:HutD family protein [Dermatophilaceae bacterium]HOI04220.1 HutD family protein [Dermatophilaceae bacterium]HPV80506.1 HutD family protein [Dermatophilaceae bacterium]HPZ68402.1 HutD family protein [Dermatophilaceae bacterium]